MAIQVDLFQENDSIAEIELSNLATGAAIVNATVDLTIYEADETTAVATLPLPHIGGGVYSATLEKDAATLVSGRMYWISVDATDGVNIDQNWHFQRVCERRRT